MSRELRILWAGRHQRRAWEELCGEYRQRISRSWSVTDSLIKVRKVGDGPERQREEGKALLAALPELCWLIAVDGRGEARSSEGFAEHLSRLRREWPHPVVFALGSDLGLDPAVRQAARESLSLGPMTLPHELARLVLYEQLYRALCLDAGINYHRA